MKKIIVLLGVFLSVNAFAQNATKTGSVMPSEHASDHQGLHLSQKGKVTFILMVTVTESEEESVPAEDLKLTLANGDYETTISYADMIHGKPIVNLGKFQVVINPPVVDRKAPQVHDNFDRVHE